MGSDVLIVGAGPTGLLLAGDLAAAGVATTVLERRTTDSNLARAFVVQARTLELLDARGIADELIATGTAVPALPALADYTIDLGGLPSRFNYLLATPQYRTEAVLQDRAVANGAEIVRGAAVTALRQDSGGVEVEARGEDGGTRSWRASYAVGADGAHSAVRAELGLPFPTRSTVLSMILADVRLSDAPREIFRLKGVPDAFCFLAAFGDGWHRAVVCDPRVQPPLDAPVGLDEVRALTERVYGTDFGMSEARWISRFHSHERQVPRYRVGRAFLAGDAAHVHSPAGGQGMNLGMQDAANLSWKLAAAVRGRAPRGLLDSYENERHPVGRLVGRNSGILTRLTVELRSPILRALRNVAAHAATTARPINRRLAGLMSGVDLRYPAPPDAHPLTGRRAPDLPLAARPGGPARLYEALRAGRFVLVTGEPVPEPIEGVDVVAPARLMGTTLLVRPDGYIGWATGDFDLDGLREALRLWYAPPDSRS